uniref:hypothetical protein n=1 Tax=Salmonella sp. s51228 TaxID=3159652 RepID=UPI00397FF5A6
ATKSSGSNFAFRFETLEAVILEGASVPYPSAGHEVQAILHYNTSSGSNEIPSTMYESIINSSIPWNCAEQQNCKAVNCPFLNFHPSYGINCTN